MTNTEKEKFEALRSAYPTFVYDAYTITEKEDRICLSFHFSITGLTEFEPTFTLPKGKDPRILSSQELDQLCFSIGLVELISYWKCTCSPQVLVTCGSLTPEQITWWKKLYYHGLGEFFYTNHLEPKASDFMNLQATGSFEKKPKAQGPFKGNLIPVGGGKDSFVTLDCLQATKDDNLTYVINPISSALQACQAAGYQDKTILVSRTLDSRLLQLNETKQYWNGHTPFSALVAFSGVLNALVQGKQAVVLSNESSANESTVPGQKINHQYSKSFEFEQDFSAYLRQYITKDIQYYSLLRPLSELQIAALFAQLKQYHAVFRSCNVGQKEGIWCTHCAKCLFVEVMLSAFLDEKELVTIFGRDMLEDPTMQDLLWEECGITANKPFECVGTRDEVNTAIVLAIRKRTGSTLPYLYQAYQKTPLYKQYEHVAGYETYWDAENQVPHKLQTLLKKRIQEAFAWN